MVFVLTNKTMTYHKLIFMKVNTCWIEFLKRKRKNKKIKIYFVCVYHLVLFYGRREKQNCLKSLSCISSRWRDSHVYSQWAMVVSVQERMSCSPHSKVTAPRIHQDVQLVRTEGRRWMKYTVCTDIKPSVWGFDVWTSLNTEYIFAISPPSLHPLVQCPVPFPLALHALFLPPLCRHPHPPLLSGCSTFLPPSSSLHRLSPSIIFIAQSNHSGNLVNEAQWQTVFKKYPLFTVYPLQIILKNPNSYILCDSDSIKHVFSDVLNIWISVLVNIHLSPTLVLANIYLVACHSPRVKNSY